MIATSGAQSCTLSSQAILAAWEEGQTQVAAGRNLVILRHAFPRMEGAALDAWSVGRRDEALLDVHEATFGSRIEGMTSSPCCGEELDLAFSAGDVRDAAGEGGREYEVTIENGTYRLTFRLPTSADLLAAAACFDEETAVETIVERCVLTAERAGEQIGVEELPDEALEALGEAMAHHDPQSDVRLDLRCPSCGLEWQVWFDIGAFLWEKLAARARQLIAEVHTLALAYKWAEADILELSERRRQTYLDMVL
jgi:hypothetical protein